MTDKRRVNFERRRKREREGPRVSLSTVPSRAYAKKGNSNTLSAHEKLLGSSSSLATSSQQTKDDESFSLPIVSFVFCLFVQLIIIEMVFSFLHRITPKWIMIIVTAIARAP